MKVNLTTVDDIKPLLSITRSNATFGTQATTYNETGYTYNQTGWTYGGADNFQDLGPKLYILNEKPSLIKVVEDAENRITITLYEGMPMGLLLTITYPTTDTIYI